MRQNNFIKTIDWTTVSIYMILVIFGWLNLYAANTSPDSIDFFDTSKEYFKQLIWIVVALISVGIIMLSDSKLFVEFAYIFYGIGILLLLAVLAFGVEINGAKAWFQFGTTRFQPVEIVKVSSTLAIARVMSRFEFSIFKVKDVVKLGLFWFAPFAIIIFQNDTGSALVFIAFFILFFREGMSPFVILFGFIAIIVFILTLLIPNSTIQIILAAGLFLIIFFKGLRHESLISFGIALGLLGVSALAMKWSSGTVNLDVALAIAMLGTTVYLVAKAFYKRISILWIYLLLFWGSIFFAYSTDYFFEKVLSDYQRSRILVLLSLKEDPLGAGYNVNQSKIAIGSGGFAGKGFLQGTQTKFNFVPEQSTDFIFCTVGEEWGFLGTTVVVAFFVFLLIRLIIISERQHSTFSRVYGYGVLGIFFFHFAINIGMTIGLAPVIGIPLPFFSYGGSSLWGFSILLFILLKLDTNRSELIR
jgi:rod shape determining protein RodA